MTFNYDMIPEGFYDKILDSKNGLRKFWHWHKFDSVLRTIRKKDKSLKVLDVGCFSGSFSGRFLPPESYHSTSIDILEDQIQYAQKRYQHEYRKFFYYPDFTEAKKNLEKESFDVVTFIEVIEHLNEEQIRHFFNMADAVTKSGSQLIITTPNYFSLWPVLEVMLNKISDVKYEEQHITKFTYWNISKKLSRIYPDLDTKYKITCLTSSHSLSPYVSIFNYKLAQWISSFYSPSNWSNPVGSILILRLEKK